MHFVGKMKHLPLYILKSITHFIQTVASQKNDSYTVLLTEVATAINR